MSEPKPIEMSEDDKAQEYGRRALGALAPVLELMKEAGKEQIQIGWTNFAQQPDGSFAVNGLHVMKITTRRIDIK